jgi:hypothetical protein
MGESARVRHTLRYTHTHSIAAFAQTAFSLQL